VTCAEIRPEQAARLKDALGRRLNYLNRLVARMNRLGFPPDDRLMAAAQRARNALQDLHVEAHYLSCRHGVGRDCLNLDGQ
jgi:hypothetical protein